MVDYIKKRIKKIQSSLGDHQAILLSKNSDVFYFSNFVNSVPEERSAFLLIGQSDSHLFLQNFLPIPKAFIGQTHFGVSPEKISKHLENLVKTLKLKEIFLDLEHLNVEEFRQITKINRLKISSLNKEKIWFLRCQKDELELKKIKKALRLTKLAILETIEELKVGMSELEVKALVESKIRQHPNCDLAFQSIVAFDENSTLPHHQASQKKLKSGSVVLLDAGAKYQEYCADMTRTIFFKEKSDQSQKTKKKELRFKKILSLVKKAYKETENLLKNNKKLKAAELDILCRQSIAQAGYEKNFIHTTGHGLGIDIHEPPSIYKTNQKKLLKNMVLTIEPGIYLEGEFGVRWENTVWTEGELNP